MAPANTVYGSAQPFRRIKPVEGLSRCHEMKIGQMDEGEVAHVAAIALRKVVPSARKERRAWDLRTPRQ
jgi:hypothetical protein